MKSAGWVILAAGVSVAVSCDWALSTPHDLWVVGDGEPDECTFDADCQDGEACERQLCTPICEDISECEEELVCAVGEHTEHTICRGPD